MMDYRVKNTFILDEIRARGCNDLEDGWIFLSCVFRGDLKDCCSKRRFYPLSHFFSHVACSNVVPTLFRFSGETVRHCVRFRQRKATRFLTHKVTTQAIFISFD